MKKFYNLGAKSEATSDPYYKQVVTEHLTSMQSSFVHK